MGKLAGRSTLPSLIPFIEWIAGVCPHDYFRAEYDLTYREITLRLRAEKEAAK